MGKLPTYLSWPRDLDKVKSSLSWTHKYNIYIYIYTYTQHTDSIKQVDPKSEKENEVNIPFIRNIAS